MNTKTLISGHAGGVVIFPVGYVVYGIIFMNYFMSNMVTYPKLMKEPMELWAMAFGNIVLGILKNLHFKAVLEHTLLTVMHE